MQNRYVGDVGDYGKFALLRQLSAQSKEQNSFVLGVIWYLFPNETHNSDGRHISYLSKDDFRNLDPTLHDSLKTLLVSKGRSVKNIETSNVLLPTTIYYREPTCNLRAARRPSSPVERVTYRTQWFQKCLEVTKSCDLVFLDPDNGIEVRSVDERHPKAGKYAFWTEICALAERGQSLVIYHHLNRTASVSAQVSELGRALRQKLPFVDRIIPLVFRRGSCRVFWLITAESLTPILTTQAKAFLAKGWSDHFDVPQVASY